jgi:hypothetical protein
MAHSEQAGRGRTMIELCVGKGSTAKSYLQVGLNGRECCEMHSKMRDPY